MSYEKTFNYFSVLIALAIQNNIFAQFPIFDNTFGTSGEFVYDQTYSAGNTTSMSLQSSGKLIVTSGNTLYPQQYNEINISRINTNGTLDNSFGVSGIAIAEINGYINCPYRGFVKPNGSILLLGFGKNGVTEIDNSDLTLVQFTPEGLLDPSFGTGGIFHSNTAFHEKMITGLLTSDGSLYAGGYKTLDRFNYNSYLPTIYKLRVGDPSGSFVQLNIQFPEAVTDDNFDGYALATVDGSSSYVFNDTLLNIEWYRGEELLSTGLTTDLNLPSGTNEVTAKAILSSGNNTTKKINISVAAARSTVAGEVTGSFSQVGNGKFVYSSSNKNVYLIDSSATISAAYLTGGAIQSAVAVGENNMLYAGALDARAYAFDLSLNSIWDKSMGGEIASTPAISENNDRLYITTNNGLLKALDPQTGQAVWSFVVYGAVFQTPIFAITPNGDRVIYFIANELSGKSYLYAVKDNGTTAELYWKFEAVSTVKTTPAILGDGTSSMIYFGDLGGNLYRVGYDGEFQADWKQNISGKVYASPLIDGNGNVYFVNDLGNLVVFSRGFTSVSEPIFRIELPSGVFGTPAFGKNGLLYVGTQGGFMYALRPQTGLGTFEIVWNFKSNSAINNHLFVTESGLVFTITADKKLFIFKDPVPGVEAIASAWSTFKGNNLRSKTINMSVVSVNSDGNKVPSEYSLLQNYPNPFNPQTVIRYQLPVAGNITLKVYNVNGEIVQTLFTGWQESGEYSIEFPKNGVSLPSGLYLYELQANNMRFIKKMVLLK